MWTWELIWFNLDLTGRTSRDSGRRFTHRTWMVKSLTEKQREFDQRHRPLSQSGEAMARDNKTAAATGRGCEVMCSYYIWTRTLIQGRNAVKDPILENASVTPQMQYRTLYLITLYCTIGKKQRLQMLMVLFLSNIRDYCHTLAKTKQRMQTCFASI